VFFCRRFGLSGRLVQYFLSPPGFFPGFQTAVKLFREEFSAVRDRRTEGHFPGMFSEGTTPSFLWPFIPALPNGFVSVLNDAFDHE